MSNPVPPAGPDAGALPFSMFGPSASGFAGGVDLMKKFWGQLPGASAIPGFLVPTVDVEELDKRIADLRAAERWLDVNLNMLRATVQGLEVQRHTIAAIQSLSTRPEAAADAGAGVFGGLPPGWPAPGATGTAKAAPEAPEPPAAAPPAWMVPAPASPAAGADPAAREPEAGRSGAADGGSSAAAGTGDATAAAVPEVPPVNAAMTGLAANSWLGFLQEQFARVAEAATATSPTAAPAAPRRAPPKTAAKAGARRRVAAVPAKAPAKRAAGKKAGSR